LAIARSIDLSALGQDAYIDFARRLLLANLYQQAPSFIMPTERRMSMPRSLFAKTRNITICFMLGCVWSEQAAIRTQTRFVRAVELSSQSRRSIAIVLSMTG
jgi:hypothetical protein